MLVSSNNRSSDYCIPKENNNTSTKSNKDYCTFNCLTGISIIDTSQLLNELSE